MWTVAKLASTKIGGFDINKIGEQFRISFHKRSVSDTDWTSDEEEVTPEDHEKTKKSPRKRAKKSKPDEEDTEDEPQPDSVASSSLAMDIEDEEEGEEGTDDASMM